MGPSDLLLVRRLKRGDGDACRELIRRHHGGVYGYLRRLGAGSGLAEDLTQEVYAKAWRSIGKLRRAASLRSWLLTIARNEYLQWVRVERPGTAGAGELPDREDRAAGAENELVRTERDRALRGAVARLDPSLQETVALHYFQDLSLREVSEVLVIPTGTVKSRLHRALGILRAKLEPTEADHETQKAGKTLAGSP